MATALAYRLITGTPFAATAGAKTVLMAIAPAGHGLTLVAFGLSMDGVTASAVPATVDIVTSTQAGAGTPGPAATITQIRGHATVGSAPTGQTNYTVEPTVLVAVEKDYIAQDKGVYALWLPLGREIECDSSGGTIKGLGIRINVTANVNVVAWMEVENL